MSIPTSDPIEPPSGRSHVLEELKKRRKEVDDLVDLELARALANGQRLAQELESTRMELEDVKRAKASDNEAHELLKRYIAASSSPNSVPSTPSASNRPRALLALPSLAPAAVVPSTPESRALWIKYYTHELNNTPPTSSLPSAELGDITTCPFYTKPKGLSTTSIRDRIYESATAREPITEAAWQTLSAFTEQVALDCLDLNTRCKRMLDRLMVLDLLKHRFPCLRNSKDGWQAGGVLESRIKLLKTKAKRWGGMSTGRRRKASQGRQDGQTGLCDPVAKRARMSEDSSAASTTSADWD